MSLLRPYIYTIIIFTSLLFNHFVLANEDEMNIAPTTIATYKEDVTGDGSKEDIVLKGHLLAEDGNYYRDVWAEISNRNGDEWHIQYKGGYNPQLKFLHLTDQSVRDIYYEASVNDDETSYIHKLHTLKQRKLKNIELPQSNHIEGSFKKNFNVEITFMPNEKPINIDISKEKEHYITKGIYDDKGNVLKESPLHMTDVFYYEPALHSEKNGYALKSYQRINGSAKKDHIGTVETLWYYKNNTWTMLKTTCIPAEPYTKIK